jgi:hypothetical protein
MPHVGGELFDLLLVIGHLTAKIWVKLRSWRKGWDSLFHPLQTVLHVVVTILKAPMLRSEEIESSPSRFVGGTIP